MKQANESKYFILLLLLVSLSFFQFCSSGKLNEETAIKIYVENLIAEESYASKPDSINIAKQKILQKYQTTVAEYEEFLNNLKYDNEKWSNFFRMADKYVNELRSNQVIQ